MINYQASSVKVIKFVTLNQIAQDDTKFLSFKLGQALMVF